MALGDFYTVLELSREASPAEIKRQYRKLSLLYHPDKKTGDEEKFAAINMAYKVLSSQKKREKYDASLSKTFNELIEAPRDKGYQTNRAFLTGDNKFNADLFMKEFENKNETLGSANITGDQDKLDAKSISELIHARNVDLDRLLGDFDTARKENAAFLQENTDQTNFNSVFNNIFEDLKKKNKEMVELGSDIVDGVATGGIEGSCYNEIGGNTYSSWDKSEVCLSSLGDCLNLQQPGFQEPKEGNKMIRKAIKIVESDLEAAKDYKRPLDETTLTERMKKYMDDKKQFAEFTSDDFVVIYNKDLLSHEEAAKPDDGEIF